MIAGARIVLAAVALVGALGAMTVLASAQHQGPHDRGGVDRGPPPLSTQDRAAFIDARIAALHAGLQLTAEQEALWPALEAAARDKAKVMAVLLDDNRNAGRPRDPIDGLRRHGEAETARGLADTKLANAAQPLWSALSVDQKRRFERLARGIIGEGRGGQPHGDEQGGPHGRRHHGAGQDGAPRP